MTILLLRGSVDGLSEKGASPPPPRPPRPPPPDRALNALITSSVLLTALTSVSAGGLRSNPASAHRGQCGQQHRRRDQGIQRSVGLDRSPPFPWTPCPCRPRR